MASNETEVVVEFRHVGSAPILKKEKAKLRIPADKPFSTATLLLRRLLSLQDSQPLVRAIPGECVARTFTARAKALSLSLVMRFPSHKCSHVALICRSFYIAVVRLRRCPMSAFLT